MAVKLSDYLRNGTEIWGNCETPTCAHGASLNIQALLDHPLVGDVTLLRLADLNLIRCDKCGNKLVHLNIHPRQARF